MDVFGMASKLFGSSRLEETETLSSSVDTLNATGVTASEDGAVGVVMDAEVTPADEEVGEEPTDETIIEMPTSPAVAEDDDVIIGLVGDGPLKVPMVLANPGSGDRTFTIANNAATAAEAAETIAGEAKEVAEAVGQHVWTDDDGLHVTEITQEEWLEEPSGANQLMNSQGTLIRDGETNQTSSTPSGYAIYDGQGNAATNIAAQFSASGQTIGKTDESHLFADYHSLQLIDKEKTPYFYVSDLRDDGGTAEISEDFYGDGVTTEFEVALPILSVVSVRINGGATTDYTREDTKFTLGTAPAEGAQVRITYITSSPLAKALTFGGRVGNIGPYSVGLGKAVEVAGAFAVAEGWATVASGSYSHAEGAYAHAEGEASHAEGSSGAFGWVAHAEGLSTRAHGRGSHAEGRVAQAIGDISHAEGYNTIAGGNESHSQNTGTIASSNSQTALGKYNIEDTANAYAVILGNGTAASRSNALTVDWSGNVTGGTLNGVDVSTVQNDLSTAQGNITSIQRDISSLDSRVDTLEAAPVVTSATGDMTSVATSKWTAIQTMSFTPGTYIVRIGCYAASATAGYRVWSWSTASSISQVVFGAAITASGNRPNYEVLTQIVQVTSTTTYRVFAWQNSGAALNMRSNIHCVKIR